MSLLGELLKAKNTLLDLAIKQLEDLTGNTNADTELIGEIMHKVQDRTRKLGLDPSDTKGIELYQALVNQVKQHDMHLASAIGGKDPSDTTEMIPLIVKKVKALDIPDSGWFLKDSVARKFLKKTPPPSTMKLLGYKSVDKLLTNESLYEIYGALRFAENGEWLNRFIKQYRQLKFADFEHRKIQIISYDENKWGDVAAEFIHKKLHNITHLKELGIVMTMPMNIKKMPGVTLKVLPLLIHYIFEVRLYSSFFKLISVKKNFGELMVDTLIADTATVSVLQNKQKIHWRVIQRYYGKLRNENHPEIFEPHVQPEDLHWRKAEDILYDIDPELEFWQGLDYVGVVLDGEPVTFNLMDIALSYSNNIPYSKRYLYHFREALWNEIFMRYLGKQALEREILEQLDNELIAPEEIKLAAK